MDRELLVSGLERIGIPLSDEVLDAIDTFISEIMLFNPVYKLVGDKDPDEILIRHVLDSAAAYPVFKRCTEPRDTIADLGSGAGFPGIVLSLLFPDRSFVLVERMQRRVGFLRGVIARTGICNAEVSDKDIKEEKRKFDAVTARAFHPLFDVADTVLTLLKPDGTGIFYKGQRVNAASELDVLRGEGYSFDAMLEDIRVPYLDERRTICVLENWKRK